MKLFGYEVELPEVENEFVRTALLTAVTVAVPLVIHASAAYAQSDLDPYPELEGW